MIINGRHIDDGEAKRQLEQIRTAVCQVPFTHPLRPVLDFLIGYIDEANGQLEDVETTVSLLEEAKKTNQEYEGEVHDLHSRISALQNNPDPALKPLVDLNL
jgi:predicted nuclease with TOPRIM domain